MQKIVALNQIGGVNQATDFRSVGKHRGQLFPVILPRTHGNGILVSPGFGQVQQSRLGNLTRRRLVDGFQIANKGLAIFPGHILEGIANLVDDTALDQGWGKYGLNGFLEAL